MPPKVPRLPRQSSRARANLDPVQFQSRPAVSLRLAPLRDVPALVALNRAAYPDLAEAEVVFTEDQLRAHVEVFPRGQLVAEIDGLVVGAIATLILSRTIEPLKP